MFQKYEESENLNNCKISENAMSSGDYIYNLGQNYVEKDGEDAYYDDTLAYYLYEELDLQKIKEEYKFYNIKIT